MGINLDLKILPYNTNSCFSRPILTKQLWDQSNRATNSCSNVDRLLQCHLISADGVESTSSMSFELGKPYYIDIDIGIDGLGLCNLVKFLSEI